MVNDNEKADKMMVLIERATIAMKAGKPAVVVRVVAAGPRDRRDDGTEGRS